MADNHDTPLEERLQSALSHIMQDEKIVKRLRFTTALLKVGATISLRQAELLASDILPYLDRQGVVLEDYDTGEQLFADFQKRALAMAWDNGSFMDNAKALKLAIKKKKGE